MYKRILVISFFVVYLIVISSVEIRAEGDVLADLSCRSAILIEQSTGKVLYEKDADIPLPMASVTKVMTMLLIMEQIDSGNLSLDEMVVGSAHAKSMGGSTIYLDEGESLSVHDMLKGIAVASANDACVAMAEHISGSEESFVARMNQRASELGMKNTVFKNTNGLDTEGHYSSARDIAIMSAELLKHRKIFDYTTIWMDSLRDGKFQLANTNKLIRFYKGANGLKTGSTDDALYCLSGAANRDGMQLIAVVMAAPSSPKRFSDASKLLDYGFANFEVAEILKTDEIVAHLPVEKGIADNVSVVTAEGYRDLGQKGTKNEIETEFHYSDVYHAPIQKGDILGDVVILRDGEEVAKINLVASHDVEKITYVNLLKKCLCAWVGGVR